MEAAHPKLEEAWRAFEDGEPERALELAARVSKAPPERWILECLAWGELGEIARSRAALERAQEESVSVADADFLWARGELLVREWRVDEAARDFEALARDERSPEVLERLSFCAELSGDVARADALYREAHRADPESFPRIPRFSEEQFEAVVREAIERLPEPFRRFLEETEVIVAPAPTVDLAQPRPAETPPDALGLFVGPSRLEQASSQGGEATPVVYLFQRNLERAARDRDELREEIVVTLYHEFGHLLGFDEEGVAELGLE